MKRMTSWMVFSWPEYYPDGGPHDFGGAFDTYEEAKVKYDLFCSAFMGWSCLVLFANNEMTILKEEFNSCEKPSIS